MLRCVCVCVCVHARASAHTHVCVTVHARVCGGGSCTRTRARTGMRKAHVAPHIRAPVSWACMPQMLEYGGASIMCDCGRLLPHDQRTRTAGPRPVSEAQEEGGSASAAPHRPKGSAGSQGEEGAASSQQKGGGNDSLDSAATYDEVGDLLQHTGVCAVCALVSVVGDVRELWPFLVALVVFSCL